MGRSAQQEANKISALRAALSQAADDFGPVPSAGVETLVPSDANSICFPRTPRQVLNVVYGGVNATQCLFFPVGMNGAIK